MFTEILMKMRLKRPFEFEITPNKVDKGNKWLTVNLKNVSVDTLTQLDIQLHSLDSYFIGFYGTGSYVSEIQPQERRSVPFQITAHGTSNVYATITGYRNGVYFYWDSPIEKIQVGTEVAELKNLFVLSHPYTSIGKTLQIEAIIQAITGGKKLELSFWVDTRTGSFEKIADIETKNLEKGEQVRYSAEFTPKETGIHEIYAYLYDGTTLLGRKNNTIYVEK